MPRKDSRLCRRTDAALSDANVIDYYLGSRLQRRYLVLENGDGVAVRPVVDHAVHIIRART